MSISFFVAKEQITLLHFPVKVPKVGTVFIRAVVEPAEHPFHAAKNSFDRAMEGEIFLNAINDPKGGKAYEAGYKWKRGSPVAEKLEALAEESPK